MISGFFQLTHAGVVCVALAAGVVCVALAAGVVAVVAGVVCVAVVAAAPALSVFVVPSTFGDAGKISPTYPTIWPPLIVSVP
jgi:hypothetical protein